MLNAIVPQFTRPAALYGSRRSFLFGAPILLAGVASLAVLPFLHVDSTPRFTVAATRRAAVHALKTIRPEKLSTARLVDRLIADAEVITSHEASVGAGDRTPGRTETAWERVLTTSRDALVSIRLQRSSDQTTWQAIAAELDKSVPASAIESDDAGVGRREIAAARRADVQYELARKFASTKAFDRAVEAGESARSFTSVVHQGWLDLHSRFGDPKNLRKWRSMVLQTIAVSKAEESTAIIVDKLNRRLIVFRSGARVATFGAEIGAKGLRQKLHSGDQATPEGLYHVADKRSPNRTEFYKALLIDYPNPEDRARFAFAQRIGQIPIHAGIGSLIEIHGEGGQGRDWTDGCVALSNGDMDRLFAIAEIGTPVTIVGTF